jgi:SAM-dependent methyltransferase
MDGPLASCSGVKGCVDGGAGTLADIRVGSQKYERFVASWFAPWAEDLVAAAGIQSGWRVLDLACGTGVVTRTVAPILGATGQVVASDLNEGMLAEAQQHPVDGAPVQWRVADATALPFETDEFDALLCQQGLQFVPDKVAAVTEMHRVLRPGGVAAVSVWAGLDENPYIAALVEGLNQHLSDSAGTTMAAPTGFGDAGALEALFVDSGFGQVTVSSIQRARTPSPAVEAIAGNLAAVPIADQVLAMTEADRSAMLDHILGKLDRYVNDGQLTAPSTANIAIATA